jgi:hypothetical protein
MREHKGSGTFSRRKPFCYAEKLAEETITIRSQKSVLQRGERRLIAISGVKKVR